MLNIFTQLSIVLGLTAALAWVTKWLRQPLLIAYIVAGILSGPLLLNIVHKEQELYQVFAQFGVIFLLFVVGLGLNFTYLKKIGKVASFVGVSQIILTTGCGFGLLYLLGFRGSSGLYLAIASVFSSTIIITKLLADKKQLDSVYGRYTVGLMLVQDILAIIIVIILNVLQAGQGNIVWSLALFVLKAAGMILFVVISARFILPAILSRIAHSAEFLFLFALAWCLGVTTLARLLGFSLETGAIMGGLALGSSPFQSEIISRIKPLRDFFLIIFFVILGSEMNFSRIGPLLVPAFLFSVFILVGNPFILYCLFRRAHFTRRNSFLSGLTAGQVSEFGFVLLFAGQALGLVGDNDVSFFTLVALLTILVSSYAITYNERLFDIFQPIFAYFKRDAHSQEEVRMPVYDIWVIGAHRIGWRICQALQRKKASFAVVDYNPETVAEVKEKGMTAYFGDVSDVEFLAELPLDKAKLIISTIPDPHDQLTFIKQVRAQGKKVYIVANLTHAKFRESLYGAGADYVMLPHVLGGELVADLIKKHSLTKAVFRDLRKKQEEEVALGFVM